MGGGRPTVQPGTSNISSFVVLHILFLQWLRKPCEQVTLLWMYYWLSSIDNSPWWFICWQTVVHCSPFCFPFVCMLHFFFCCILCSCCLQDIHVPPYWCTWKNLVVAFA
jgi:hypothetical protein